MSGEDILARFNDRTLGYTYMGRFRGLHGPDLAKDVADGA
jgi:hypothetical protein